MVKEIWVVWVLIVMRVIWVMWVTCLMLVMEIRLVRCGKGKGKKNGIFYLSASPHHILNILFVTSIFCNLSERWCKVVQGDGTKGKVM